MFPAARQRGQIAVFFALVVSGLVLLAAVAWEVGRIAYARGEVVKAADAAALAAASQVDIAHYRETGEARFLPDARAVAQNFASLNSGFLRARNIGVAVTGIGINSATLTVSVTVAADLSALLPGFLPFRGLYGVTGYAEARVDGR